MFPMSEHSTEYADFDYTAVESSFYDYLQQAIEKFPYQTREMIRQRFGFYGTVCTYQEMANHHGLCTTYVQRIVQNALRHLWSQFFEYDAIQLNYWYGIKFEWDNEKGTVPVQYKRFE